MIVKIGVGLERQITYAVLIESAPDYPAEWTTPSVDSVSLCGAVSVAAAHREHVRCTWPMAQKVDPSIKCSQSRW